MNYRPRVKKMCQICTKHQKYPHTIMAHYHGPHFSEIFFGMIVIVDGICILSPDLSQFKRYIHVPVQEIYIHVNTQKSQNFTV